MVLGVDELHGPLIAVSLRPEPLRAEMLRRAGRPVPAQVQGWGLIDTGAKQTSVDHRVGAELYQQVGVALAWTPSTPDEAPHETSVFYGFLTFPGTGLPILEQEMLGMSLGYPVQGKRVLALLGRDFLAPLRLVYDGPAGQVSLAW